jgi:hypothetical protein
MLYKHPHIPICMHAYIHYFIHSSMALQHFVGPWLLLQFRNLFYTDGRTPWTSDQPAARPLPTHRTTQNKRTDIHALSAIRTHDPSNRASEDSLCLRPRSHCDGLLTYIHACMHKYTYIHYIRTIIYHTID